MTDLTSGLPSGAAPALAVGDEPPPLALPPLTRLTIAIYAAGSGDHVPLHLDSDFARQAGYRDVFMHGSLGMAYVGRFLRQVVPQSAIRELRFRFSGITYPGEQLTCRGKVLERKDGTARIGFTLTNPEGDVKLSGDAAVTVTP
jgi:acyl dehydratase